MTYADFSTYTDEQLVNVFWYGDSLTDKEYNALEDELEKRKIDPFVWEKSHEEA